MSEDKRQFLALLGQSHARFTVEEAGWVLNFQPYEILALVALGILQLLGDPEAPNAIKFFLAEDILAFAKDRAKMKKATNAMYRYRQNKNLRQKTAATDVIEVGRFLDPVAGKSDGH